MKWMISSRFLLRKGWYFPSLFVLLALWVLSLGPGLYDPSPYAHYRIYFPPNTEKSLSAADAMEQTDSLKQMVLYSVEMVRKHNWNFQLFSSVCHSKPERSVFLNGIQMPVNSRCSGIFSGLLYAILLIPLVGHRFYRKKWVLSLLAFTFLFQFIDVGGNVMGWWTNSVASRILLGFPLGMFMILALTDLFIQPRMEEDNHTTKLNSYDKY